MAIDENEQERLGLLLRRLFPESDLTCVTVIHNPGGIQGDNFSYTHEYAYFVYPSDGVYIGRIERDEGNIVPLRDWGAGSSTRDTARNCFYPIYVQDGEIIGFGDVCEDEYHPESANIKRPDGVVEVYPIDQHGVERKWRHARQSIEKIKKQLICEQNNGEWAIRREKAIYRYKTVWTESKFNSNTYGSKLLNSILGEKSFSFPKSVHNVSECLAATTRNDEDAIVLDFFAGSGTTAHAVMNLNREDGGHRKYILVEMADYFDDVLLPRIKKVAFSDDWKDGQAQAGGQGISHFVKYYELEQYEDALRKAKYEDSDLFHDPYRDPYHQYVFLRDLKMLEALGVDLEQGEVKVDLSKLYDNIDIAETLSNLRGKWIKRITPDFVEFEDGERVDINNLDYRLIKPLIWW